MKQKAERKISGYLMIFIGFIMLVINATSYIFHLDFKAPVLTIIGIVFVVIGSGIVRKSGK